jgi:hypothetical protein
MASRLIPKKVPQRIPRNRRVATKKNLRKEETKRAQEKIKLKESKMTMQVL